MGQTPTTTHKGFKITFSDVMEDWNCHEIGKSSQSLKAVRSQIDTHLRKMRKGQSVSAYELETLFRHTGVNQDTKTASFRPVTVIEYLGEDTGRFSRGGVEVAVMPEGGSRKKTHLKNLYKATPENEETLERAHQKGLEAVSAINQMNLILGELERLDQQSIEALARLSETVE